MQEDRTMQPVNHDTEDSRLASVRLHQKPLLNPLKKHESNMDKFQFILLNGRLLNLQQKYALTVKRDEDAPPRQVEMLLLSMSNALQEWIVEYE